MRREIAALLTSARGENSHDPSAPETSTKSCLPDRLKPVSTQANPTLSRQIPLNPRDLKPWARDIKVSRRPLPAPDPSAAARRYSARVVVMHSPCKFPSLDSISSISMLTGPVFFPSVLNCPGFDRIELTPNSESLIQQSIAKT